jgi:hypothetical protein
MPWLDHTSNRVWMWYSAFVDVPLMLTVLLRRGCVWYFAVVGGCRLEGLLSMWRVSKITVKRQSSS